MTDTTTPRPSIVYLPAAAGSEALVIEEAFIDAIDYTHEDDRNFVASTIIRLPVVGWWQEPGFIAHGMVPIFPVVPGGAKVLAYCLHLGNGIYLANDAVTCSEEGARKELVDRYFAFQERMTSTPKPGTSE
jgi:hypothetical protein